MILASFLKIWHLIPIVLAIVLFKKLLNHRDKKNRILKNEEKEKNGLTLEVRVRKKYEDLGYKVINQENKNNGIDLHMTRNNKTLIFHCKNETQSKAVTEEDIKTFHKNASDYIKTNEIEAKDAAFRYVIPFSDILHKSAVRILTDDSYNCKYVVV